jgi:uncharacterized RDD family membrane protein YckC
MSEDTVELHLAKWSDRFFAWLIDFVIVIVVVEAFLRAATLPFWLDNDPNRFFNNMEPLHYLIRSLAFFAYWTFFESSKGQSIGKMILHLKTVDLTGKNVSVRNIAVASFGKAFLLPIDLILGWIFTNEKRQRVFNKISDTIVIKMKEQEGVSSNVRYSKE